MEWREIDLLGFSLLLLTIAKETINDEGSSYSSI